MNARIHPFLASFTVLLGGCASAPAQPPSAPPPPTADAPVMLAAFGGGAGRPEPFVPSSASFTRAVDGSVEGVLAGRRFSVSLDVLEGRVPDGGAAATARYAEWVGRCYEDVPAGERASIAGRITIGYERTSTGMAMDPPDTSLPAELVGCIELSGLDHTYPRAALTGAKRFRYTVTFYPPSAPASEPHAGGPGKS